VIPPEDALLELKRCAGTQFDPLLVTHFEKLLFRDGTIREV
jgi:HD-GYP domain-containing protein (c-di-GMP phosphodiesterase class II)